MYIQIPNGQGGYTFVFLPEEVPPSVSQLVHEREAAQRAAQGPPEVRDDADVKLAPQKAADAHIAAYPYKLRAMIEKVGPSIEFVPGEELSCGAHGETDEKATPPTITLPHDLPLTVSGPSPGGRRVEEHPSLRGVLDHEIGHAIEAEFEKEAKALDPEFSLKAIYDSLDLDQEARNLSQYVKQDRHEWFSESLASWLHPAYQGSGLQVDPDLEAAFAAVLGAGGEERKDSATTASAGGGEPDALAGTSPTGLIRGAGVMLLHKADDGDRALFVKHKERGTWELPGGVVEDGESAETAAEREVGEEIGASPYGRLSLLMRDRLSGVDYSTFQARVADAFTPVISDELEGFAWAPVTQPPEPLHPGVRLVLERMRMNELDIARAIRDGRLSSPQQYANLWLFSLRITGTGASYRPEYNEHVWRDPGIYLNNDFLERCQGLFVIWQHPPGNELTQPEFENRVIGSIMLPYIWQDEVWGVAKIMAQDVAQLMLDRPLSTSPSVSFNDPAINETQKLDGGRTLLIEGIPSLLDHLAVCELGVWDKGGEPTGVGVGEPERAEGSSDELPDEAPNAVAVKADSLTRLSAAIESLDVALDRLGT